jgi:hypothetical protein
MTYKELSCGFIAELSIIGETGVYRDTGSKGTVGGKIEDVHKI